MSAVRAFLTIAHLTLHEALRRRILLAALICGVAFLALFGTGLHFMLADIGRNAAMPALEKRLVTNFLALAGLYAVNFLVVMTSVLLPVDALSGEIASGVIQTVASKPVPRASIVLGKWAAYVLLVAGYLTLLAGGVLAIVRVRGHFVLPGTQLGLPLMLLEGVVLVTLSIAGGTRLSTVTNGVMAFGLYGLAFIGGWVEQVSTFASNEAARNVGVVASLIMPTEALWQLAAHHMQPTIMSELSVTPFSPASVPSGAMVVWAAGYALVVLLVALRAFAKRPL
jgi:ABC-type transport system involved in multi-copper enzyme maturation permease subunit